MESGASARALENDTEITKMGHNDHSLAAFHKMSKRACDCCRKRKVRCDGSEPCGPCTKASIRCAYLQPAKKKGPKGLRSAKVLHALRRIDSSMSDDPSHSSSPQQPSFENWSWTETSMSNLQNSNSNATVGSVDPQSQPDSDNIRSGMTSITPPQHLTPPRQLLQGGNTWSAQQQHTRTLPERASMPSCSLPMVVDMEFQNLRFFTDNAFRPYVDLFFEHMFVIMPVVDRSMLNEASSSTINNPSIYCLLCALSAATIVQLDESIQKPIKTHHEETSASSFVEECLRVRQTLDYAEDLSTVGILTSFFLFAYNVNLEQHTKAWHYLQESITMAENLNMDDERLYERLDPVEAQWRRRLYWLLFITERSYAVQRRKHARLYSSVEMPAVFDSEDPQLLNGFVKLADLFSAVDESFVQTWRGSRRTGVSDEAWLARTQKRLNATKETVVSIELTETQHLDIAVTREWLHVLAWQMGVSNGLIWTEGEGDMRLDYPVELARNVVGIISGATPSALDSHGIGMEQKISDIAGCLADVLRCTGDMSTTFFEGKKYLKILLQRLSSIRGKESRYLKPLLSRMDHLLSFEVSLPTSSSQDGQLNVDFGTALQDLPLEAYSGGPRLSIQESLGMLRTLSMSGTISIPGLAVLEDWTPQRHKGDIHGGDGMGFLRP